MAIDNTPPRLKLITTIAIITVVTLVAIDFVSKSYFALMTDEAARGKIAPTTEKTEQLKAEQAAFAKAATPIDEVVAQLGKGVRSELVTPVQSEDLGPMTGWSQLPKPAPVPQPRVEAATSDGGALTAVGDGGVPLATDAGAPATGSDAGVKGALLPSPTLLPAKPGSTPGQGGH
jgi:hypothetical protein